MQIILIKRTLYDTEKCQKAKISPFISWQNPLLVYQGTLRPTIKSKTDFSSPGRSPGGAIVLPPASLVVALAKC